VIAEIAPESTSWGRYTPALATDVIAFLAQPHPINAVEFLWARDRAKVTVIQDTMA